MRLTPIAARTFLITVFALLAAAVSCSSGGDSDKGREEVLTSLADRVFVPAYQQAAADAGSLVDALDELQTQPDETSLAAAQDTWKRLRLSWSRTLAFDHGPADTRRSMSLVDWFPVEPERIESRLAENAETSPVDVVEFLSSSQRGLGAIEYLLFPADNGTELSGDDGGRLSYALALATVVRDELSAVADAWVNGTEDDSAYRDRLTGNAPASVAVNDAIRDIVRSPVFLLQTVADMQLAPAVGLRGGGTDLSGLPSLASGYSLEDIRSRLMGVRNVYLGADDGMGISDLVADMSTDTDTRMRDALDDVFASLDAIEQPLDVAAVENPAAVSSLFDSVKFLQTVLNTEVVSLLNVTIGFSDNDGDSSN